MNTEILEPVLDDDGKPVWLSVKREFISDGRDIKEIIKKDEKLKVKKIFEIKQQGIWQCQKCGCLIQSNPDPPMECYEEQGGCGRTPSFKAITKIINADLWKLPYWVDIQKENLDFKKTYNEIIKIMKKLLVLPEEMHYKIISLWIISTWKSGYWNTVAFPIFRGEYNTGKTTALDFICELGYRMIHSAGTTFPAMVRATHFHNAGLCIDEASDRLNPKYETGREMLNFVKPSYRKGSLYTIADRENPEEMICYKNFGFKAFAGEKNFDPALLSRSIDILMQEEIPEIPNIKYVQEELDEIQIQLLNYRYKTDEPPDLGIDFCLKGRLREIFESIIATGKHIGIDVEDVKDFALNIKKEREEELQDTLEFDILSAIEKLSNIDTQSKITGETDAPEDLEYKSILKEMFPKYDDMENEQRKQKAASLGYSIKNRLHLKKKRMGKGTVLILNDKKNQKRLNYLYKKYKVGE